jgi:folylpolyglutamate synthase/dihydropteroate synthase
VACSDWRKKMTQVSPSKQIKKFNSFEKKYTYKEIILYLDTHWHVPIISLEPFKNILLAINPSLLLIPSIIISGTSGKTITAHFVTALFNQENISVTTFSSPHFIQYNEQITTSSKQINNVEFEQHALILLDESNKQGHVLHSHELLFGIALLHSFEKKTKVIIVEQKNIADLDPVMLLTPRIIGITRIDKDQVNIQKAIISIFSSVSSTTFIVSADQNKQNLSLINFETKTKKAQWLMPIRKIAPLPYPYQQIHGRCASLAERILTTYLHHFISQKNKKSLLNQPKKDRGRPTVQKQKEALLDPKKTIQEFWEESKQLIPGKFQLLKTKKASILLDSADSIDSFDNLLLGIRLLAYKLSIHTVFMIIGNNNSSLDHETFIKKMRYFFKRNNGKIFFCPVKIQPQNNSISWNPEQICNSAKNVKIRSTAYSSFEDAFDNAQKESAEDSLIVITGSNGIITEYWNHKHV